MTYAPPPAPGYNPIPQPTSPRPLRKAPGGSIALIWVGGVLLTAAFVAGMLGIGSFLRTVPTDIVGPMGDPGESALASGDVPGEADLAVEANGTYAVWALVGQSQEPFSLNDVVVTCDGAAVQVSYPSVSGESSVNGYSASTVAEFVAPDRGSCTVTVDAPLGGVPGTFLVAEGSQFGEFFTSVGVTVLLAFVAIGGGILGLGLLVGGIVWRVVARRR